VGAVVLWCCCMLQLANLFLPNLQYLNLTCNISIKLLAENLF
jgi:hypothetical protein